MKTQHYDKMLILMKFDEMTVSHGMVFFIKKKQKMDLSFFKQFLKNGKTFAKKASH